METKVDAIARKSVTALLSSQDDTKRKQLFAMTGSLKSGRVVGNNGEFQPFVANGR